MALQWRGDKVIKKMDGCIIKGMAQTISESVIHAKSNHGKGAHSLGRFVTQTATLEGSIREVVHPRKVGDEFVGLWGSVDVEYALVLELGSMGRVGIPPYPYLRPAAEAEYPKLAGRIRKCFEGGKTLVTRESITLRSGRTIEAFRPI